MTSPPEPRFHVPQDVLDRLDDIADIELEPDWRDHPPNELIAAVAQLDETMADHCEQLGFKGDMAETMERLIYELWRRRDQPRYSTARVALEVMESARAYVAAATAPLN